MNFAPRYFAPRYFAPRYFGTKRKTVPTGGGGLGMVLPFAARKRGQTYAYAASGGLTWGGAAGLLKIKAVIAAGGMTWGGAATHYLEPSRYVLARQEDELWLLAE